MHDVEAKNDPTRPAYSMVIYQVIDKLKLVLLFAAQYLTKWVKMTVIFISYGTLALAFCPLQIRHR